MAKRLTKAEKREKRLAEDAARQAAQQQAERDIANTRNAYVSLEERIARSQSLKSKRDYDKAVKCSTEPNSPKKIELTQQDKRELAAITARLKRRSHSVNVTRSEDHWKDGWERTHRKV